MRKMKNEFGEVTVTEHIMLKNFWEYFITDDKHCDDIVRAVVMGFETEIGDISLSEIRPYVMTRTNKLDEIMPAQGWQWVEA